MIRWRTLGTEVFSPVPSQPTCADWLIGEDVWMFTDEKPGLRSMADPAQYDDPDHYLELEHIDTNIDNGGVHTNSGIPNHAYYLLVNGGSNAGCGIVHPNLTHTADCSVNVSLPDWPGGRSEDFLPGIYGPFQ